MRELSFKMVIRAYLICALMTSILGIISCSVHDIINCFPFVLLYAWIILSPISILALITVYLLGVQRDWICKIPLICLCAFIVYFINLNSSESYLINFFATQIVPYDLLYYNNGIEIRVNDTIFSIFTWVLSYFILVLLIVISTHIPFLIIHDDRLDIYEQRKRTYRTIYFKDVEQFRLISIYSNNYIAIDYCTVPLMRKMDNASCLTQRMMKFNVSVSGAIESILVQNLTMRGKEICNTLNNRMKIWRSNCN